MCSLVGVANHCLGSGSPMRQVAKSVLSGDAAQLRALDTCLSRLPGCTCTAPSKSPLSVFFFWGGNGSAWCSCEGQPTSALCVAMSRQFTVAFTEACHIHAEQTLRFVVWQQGGSFCCKNSCPWPRKYPTASGEGRIHPSSFLSFSKHWELDRAETLPHVQVCVHLQVCLHAV